MDLDGDRTELLTTESQWSAAFPVIRELRPDLELTDLLKSRETLNNANYRLYGTYGNSRIVTVAGVVLTPHIKDGVEMWIHDMVTTERLRGRGYGARMLDFLKRECRNLGCSRLILYSRLHRVDAHRFYEEKGGMERYGIVFQERMDSEAS